MQLKLITIFTSVLAWISFGSAWHTPLVQLDKGLIPKLDGALPILSLGPHAAIPQDLLTQFVNAADPNATFVTQRAYNGDRLVAFVDSGTGETRVFPDFGILDFAEGPINISLASDYIRDNRTFPVDDTNFSVVTGSNLMRSTLRTEGNISEPQLFLTHAVVRRNITSGGRTYPVCGPGSRASFGFAADGHVHSLSYIWKPATLTKQDIRSKTVDAVFDSIVKQLTPVASKGGPVKVDTVDICFFDSHSRFIQPVYRFSATLHANSVNNATTSPTHIQGFLPIGHNSPEAIPHLKVPPHTSQSRELRDEKRAPKPDIRIGRYVVRDDYTEWFQNANDFLSNLQDPTFDLELPIIGVIPGHLPPIANFIDSQFVGARPSMFTTDKNSFINSVHIADTEAHGNWHLFSTEKNCCDLVNLSDIPEDGYGGGAGGSLAYWILHSCEVIPTPTDYSAADRHIAFDVWVRIFNGLHAVVGFRTFMSIRDSVMLLFGRSIATGAPFVSSWLQIVHDDFVDYYGEVDFNKNRGFDEPRGRPSAVVVCGHESDTVLQVENLGRPGCLAEWWYEN